MKLKHILGVSLAIVGLLFIWHMYSQHGGVAGFKSGLGI